VCPEADRKSVSDIDALVALERVAVTVHDFDDRYDGDCVADDEIDVLFVLL
jgi:hypothetical protein